MLQLEHVYKSYKKEKILKDICISFSDNGLYSILGPSGSGKSTLLNLIFGITKVSSGDIYYDNLNITKMKNRKWDMWRNNTVSFIFQDYKLIDNMSVIDNIKLGENLSVKRSNIIDIMNYLGIYDIRNKNVNLLSGGEKQRVAIARTMVNDPRIILCDEPTGALDSENSIKIMNILSELSKDKLVIMVTHNKELAEIYSKKIYYIKDGIIDENTLMERSTNKFKLKKTKIRFLSTFKLALGNLKRKKLRTILTSFSNAIGLICVSLVLLLSSSFSREINSYEDDIISKVPIVIGNGSYEKMVDKNNYDMSKVNIKKEKDFIHTNKIDKEFMDYFKNISNSYYVSYNYDISMPIIGNNEVLDLKYFNMLPYRENYNYYQNYELVSGRYINNSNELLLKVDSYNRVSDKIMELFNIKDNVNYEDVLGKYITIIDYDKYYSVLDDNIFVNDKYDGNKLFVVGIIREKEIVDDNSYIMYDHKLLDKYIERNKNSLLVKSILDNKINLFGTSREELLNYFLYNSIPNKISIYVNNTVEKDNLFNSIKLYNNSHDNKIIYVDTTKEMIDLVKDIIKIITVVLASFSIISIIVSSIMIMVLTNTSVLERIKEIGILRSLGGRRRDITRLFNLENMMIGIISSMISLFGIYLMINPINRVLDKYLEIGNIVDFDYKKLLIISLISIIFTVISGYVPSRMASKREIIDCFNN